MLGQAMIVSLTRIQAIAKTRSQKKRQSRARKAKGSFGPLSQSLSGFPKKLRFKHEYYEVLSIAATTGATISYLHSCNGLYDPDITGTGHQPSYFDQLTSIYDHYTVMESMIELEVVSDIVSYFALYIDDDTATANTLTQAAEQPTGQLKMIPALQDPVRFVSRWNAKEWFGGDILDNDNLQGNASNNPTEQSYFTFKGRSANGTSTANFSIKVKLTYWAVWDELATMPQS